MPFTFTRLEIPDVIRIEAKAFGDARGFFMETFKQSEFERYGVNRRFVQDNHSHSIRGVLRGLHYQKDPCAQGKLVYVITGEVFDVAVDMRMGSPTYGRWVAEVLSAANHRMLWVPEGFAHGFLVLSDQADVVYKVTSEYSPEHDRGIRWDEPSLSIPWPIPEPILSAKDAQQLNLEQADNNFVYRG